MRKLSVERCSLAVNSERGSKKLLSGRCYLGLSEAADEVSSCRTSRRVREACQLTAGSTKVDRYPPLGDMAKSSYVQSLYYCRGKFQAHRCNNTPFGFKMYKTGRRTFITSDFHLKCANGCNQVITISDGAIVQTFLSFLSFKCPGPKDSTQFATRSYRATKHEHLISQSPRMATL